jgi:hypothetical protein
MSETRGQAGPQFGKSNELDDSDGYDDVVRKDHDDGEKDEEKTQESEEDPEETAAKFHLALEEEDYEDLLEPFKKRRLNRTSRNMIRSDGSGEHQQIPRTTLLEFSRLPGSSLSATSSSPRPTTAPPPAAGPVGAASTRNSSYPGNKKSEGIYPPAQNIDSAALQVPHFTNPQHDHLERSDDCAVGGKADRRNWMSYSSPGAAGGENTEKNMKIQDKNTTINQHSHSDDSRSSSSSSSSEEGGFVVPSDDFVVAISDNFGYGSQYLPAAVQRASSAPFLGVPVATRRAPGGTERPGGWIHGGWSRGSSSSTTMVPSLNLARRAGAAPLARSSTANPASQLEDSSHSTT